MSELTQEERRKMFFGFLKALDFGVTCNITKDGDIYLVFDDRPGLPCLVGRVDLPQGSSRLKVSLMPRGESDRFRRAVDDFKFIDQIEE